MATRKTYSKTWGLAVPILYTLLGGKGLTRGRIEKMQRNYVWYAHPPKKYAENATGRKIEEKKISNIYIYIYIIYIYIYYIYIYYIYIVFFLAIVQLKTEVRTCKLRLAEMRWEIDVAELCQKIMRENCVWNVLRKKKRFEPASPKNAIWTTIAKKTCEQ